MKSHTNNFIRIKPINHSLAATVEVPGSKSITNRALLLSVLANGVTRIKNTLISEDTNYMSRALTSLGFEVNTDISSNTIIVKGLDGEIPSQRANLFVGNAGTAVRFLTGLLTLGYGEFSIDGVSQMRKRPIGDLVNALNELGACISAKEYSYQSKQNHQVKHCPPVDITGDGLLGGTTSIRGDISSQFISALLMTAPYADTEVKIIVNEPVYSKPYIDLTIKMMEDFSVKVDRDQYSLFIIQPQHYFSPGEFTVECDASSASYFFAAPAICGGWVEVKNISGTSIQGDIKFLDVLSKMGCNVSDSGNSVRVTSNSRLEGIDVNLSDISDTSMSLAVLAPFAQGPTRIRGIRSSRLKETDRISAICTELNRLGVKTDEHDDGMTIYPCENIKPGKVNPYNDHRIAMAFTLIGLRIPGIEIENPSCVEKTFPNYYEVLDSLY